MYKENLYLKSTSQDKKEAERMLKALLESSKNTIYQIIITKNEVSGIVKNLVAVGNEITSIDYYICVLLENTRYTAEGVYIKSLANDKGASLIYSLSEKLFGDGNQINRVFP